LLGGRLVVGCFVIRVGVGALVAPAAVEALGLRLSFVMAGALLPLVALLARPGLRRVDDASEPPSLALLAMTTVELLRALLPNDAREARRPQRRLDGAGQRGDRARG
jgi:hypothetical protein